MIYIHLEEKTQSRQKIKALKKDATVRKLVGDLILKNLDNSLAGQVCS